MSDSEFSGDYAEIIYPALKAMHFFEDKAGDYAVKILDKFGPEHGKQLRRVMELCCGDGTDAKIIQEAGYDIDGLDLSEEFVKLAVEKIIGTEDYAPVVIHCDATSSGWVRGRTETYDAVICLMSAVLIEDIDRFIVRARDALKFGGIFAFDFRNASAFSFTSSDHREENFGGIRRVVDEHISGNKRTANYHYEYEVNGEKRQLDISHVSYLRFPWVVSDKLVSHGFEILGEYKWNTFDRPIHQKDKDIMIVARKV